MIVQTSQFRVSRFAFRVSAPAFSLVEVLLAMFILGIGMIMVASVFPVGADWTRQTAEESVGQTVALDALSVLKAHYGPGGNLAGFNFFAPDFHSASNRNTILQNDPATGVGPFALQALPGFISNNSINNPGVPPAERAYRFGSNSPFPATNWQSCTYFWTALARLSPAHRNLNPPSPDPDHGISVSPSYNYDVYILVFRKGAADQIFSSPPFPLQPSANSPLPSQAVYAEISGTRDPTWPTPSLVPSVGYVQQWFGGSFDSSQTPSVYDAIPPVGQYGIGVFSGTVFKQVLDPSSNYQSATPRPNLMGSLPQNNSNRPSEPIIFAPPADNTDRTASPLIYVYQTTLTF